MIPTIKITYKKSTNRKGYTVVVPSTAVASLGGPTRNRTNRTDSSVKPVYQIQIGTYIKSKSPERPSQSHYLENRTEPKLVKRALDHSYKRRNGNAKPKNLQKFKRHSDGLRIVNAETLRSINAQIDEDMMYNYYYLDPDLQSAIDDNADWERMDTLNPEYREKPVKYDEDAALDFEWDLELSRLAEQSAALAFWEDHVATPDALKEAHALGVSSFRHRMMYEYGHYWYID